MSELNNEQIIKALECCGSKGSPKCADCPMEEKRGCAIELYRVACTCLKELSVVKHGNWIDNHCTVCGRQPIGDEAWTKSGLTPPIFKYCMSFCPCCGATMDSEGRNNDE